MADQDTLHKILELAKPGCLVEIKGINQSVTMRGLLLDIKLVGEDHEKLYIHVGGPIKRNAKCPTYRKDPKGEIEFIFDISFGSTYDGQNPDSITIMPNEIRKEITIFRMREETQTKKKLFCYYTGSGKRYTCLGFNEDGEMVINENGPKKKIEAALKRNRNLDKYEIEWVKNHDTHVGLNKAFRKYNRLQPR